MQDLKTFVENTELATLAVIPISSKDKMHHSEDCYFDRDNIEEDARSGIINWGTFRVLFQSPLTYKELQEELRKLNVPLDSENGYHRCYIIHAKNFNPKFPIASEDEEEGKRRRSSFLIGRNFDGEDPTKFDRRRKGGII